MEDLRELPCGAPPLPAGIADCVSKLGSKRDWARSTVGQSGGDVWRVTGADGGHRHYLKHGTGEVAAALIDELARLRWLAPHLPVPHVAAFALEGDAAWLLMTAVPGKTASELLTAHPEQAEVVVDAIAVFLRRLHAIAPESCPFTAAAPHRLALARDRIARGLVDEDDFDDVRAGWSAARVWQALHDLPLPGAPPVVTHGDFSLDNILVAEGAVTGCIDVGRAGLADRYQDIAILWNSLGEFSPDLQARLLAALGEGAGDRERIDFHLLLDELF
ncbi:MAG: aminoglycoside 3'-phosphotransferase [Novosphingobium sp.]|nr:aminoglycoside 3'-phosphotransferase [Novosphingobium sp.]